MLMNATLTIMATGYTCIRRFLCLFNLLIWLTGSCILGIGIWLTLSYDTYARILPSYHLLSADNLALAVGGLTFFTAFCGCCGAWFQSKFLLVVYLSTIILIMLIEIALGVVCFAWQTQLASTLQSELLDGIQNRYVGLPDGSNNTEDDDDKDGFRSTWDHIQTKFRCCGVNNHTDWYHITAWPDKERVPDSCCRPFSPPIYEDKSFSNSTASTKPSNETNFCGLSAPSVDPKLLWKHGCYAKVRYYLLTNIHGVGVTSILFAFVQFVALVCAFLVVYTMDYKKDRRKLKMLSTAPSRSTYNRIRTM